MLSCSIVCTAFNLLVFYYMVLYLKIQFLLLNLVFRSLHMNQCKGKDLVSAVQHKHKWHRLCRIF